MDKQVLESIMDGLIKEVFMEVSMITGIRTQTARELLVQEMPELKMFGEVDNTYRPPQLITNRSLLHGYDDIFGETSLQHGDVPGETLVPTGHINMGKWIFIQVTPV